ncbi:MAG: hypothetical protein ACI35W_04920 [Anaeroplasmataceae bacterium]
MKVLFNEDFNDFPLEELPYDKDHSALGEYHTVINEGYMGNWYDPICNHQWRSQGGSWIITNYDNKRYLTQNRGDYSVGHFKSVSSLLILKEKIYSAYTIDVKIRLLSTNEYSGVVFNYITSRNYYSVSIKEGSICLYHRDQEEITVIKEAPFEVDEYKLYSLRVIINNDVKVYIDNVLILEANINILNSKCGVIAKGAVRYTDFIISMSDEEYNHHIDNKNKELEALKEKQAKYPKIELINKISLGDGGSARQIRFAHKKNGELFFIFAQHQKMIMRDSFAQISCLTAIDLKGNIMWQIGEPNNSDNNTRISADLPFQVCDINNDGRDELIYSRDFYVIIVDAETSKEISRMKTPLVDSDFGSYPYKRLNVDAIRVADFKGVGYKNSFIIKDRYKNVFAYDNEFNLLWRYVYKNTGHFPYIYDFNNDGCDEMYVGYSMVDSKGNIMWSLPIESDHTDEIIYINTMPNEPKRLYLASGNEGFNICNLDGSIFKHNEVGHAQRISIANYNRKNPGLDICVTSFWGANDIIYMFDAYGNKYKEKEMMYNGNVITPVAYDGENELILASAVLGLLDSDLDTIVKLPEDGHPTLCADAYDIDDDGIDEILIWNQYNMYIYKASKYKSGNKYEKYPSDAMSNYRGEYLIKK